MLSTSITENKHLLEKVKIQTTIHALKIINLSLSQLKTEVRREDK